ncbi:ribosome small subunit-dependent GTPase A [Frankia sp. CNm7]|uniref:Small ribosomal subunit biogenesis GTPase RsgA n=1 Tax=Frankia nepalensis TaxID=1836974 RepID=A0A937REU5_9ACTN|nr:ribosome small subunit-dependent GTPase A [Frankia nepalensis]MBL7511734.1 ribosome small subunit-dependent GTPase A [Frankia nepalensis]MBL7524732.1 ribosome small subunit-dependent GTPase A [Frankia nepalensis]MBL7629120.1 ribosome small subunit-dependent GTPase A [Frankia nepalensis]
MTPPAPAAPAGPPRAGQRGACRYGWTDEAETAFTAHRAAGLVPARVARAHRGGCDVVLGGRHSPTVPGDDNGGYGFGGDEQIRAVVPPNLAGSPPSTGDWVALRPAAGGTAATIAHVLPRRSALVRAAASGRSDPQVLAANVDLVAIVVAADVPPDLGRVERLLALGWESGGTPLIVLTKADAPGHDPAGAPSPRTATRHDEIAAVAPGVDVLVTSAVTGAGLDALAGTLAGATAVLVGASGAGKSTLANALLGADLLAVGAVRHTDGKGRHTTVSRELVALPTGGVLIDTPGLRAVGLWDAEDGLGHVFAEIDALADDCRFADCGHVSEPGCAVLAAVDAGHLPARRLDSYHKLLREQEWMAARSDARLRAERERRWKEISRAQRRLYEGRGGGRR